MRISNESSPGPFRGAPRSLQQNSGSSVSGNGNGWHPPPKKKHLLFVWKSGVYIYTYQFVVCYYFFCLSSCVCFWWRRVESNVKTKQFAFKKTDVDFVGRKRKQRIIFLDDPWVDFGFRAFLQHREVLLCAPFGTLAMTRMSCWSWNKLPTWIFWLMHYVTPPGMHNRWVAYSFLKIF